MTDGIPGDGVESRDDIKRHIERLVMRCRELEADHDPDGWPAIQMRDVTALCNEIDQLRDVVERAKRLLSVCSFDAPEDTSDYEIIFDA